MTDENNVLFIRDETEDTLSSDNQETSDIDDDMDMIVQGYNEITKVSHSTLAKEMSANSKLTVSERNKKSYRKNKRRSIDESDSPALLAEGDSWTVNMHCRATYEEDGQDYEAIITEIFPDNTCNVEFIGYKNIQLVYIADLVPSWGKLARKHQEKEAAKDVLTKVEHVDENVAGFEDVKPKSNRNKGNPLPSNYVPPPQWVPSVIVPPQPPIPPVLAGLSENPVHDEALSAMLMSWYMNGFYTGVYYAQNQK